MTLFRLPAGDITEQSSLVQAFSQQVGSELYFQYLESGGFLVPVFSDVEGATDCPELPESPEGFDWKFLPESSLAVLAPNDWHFLNEPGDSTQNYFISRENIGDEGSFKTGLTINVIRNDKKDALRTAKDLPSQIMKLADIEPVDVTERTDGNLTIYEFQYSKDFGEYTGTMYQFIAADKETNTVYVITFESPSDEWERAWEIGRMMLEQIMFLDNQ